MIKLWFIAHAFLLLSIAYGAWKASELDGQVILLALGRESGLIIGTLLGWMLHRQLLIADPYTKPQHKRPIDRNPEDV
jgi:hypothetical protein